MVRGLQLCGGPVLKLLLMIMQPEKVFAEIYRVLKPGGSCIVTFSNRLFYDKASRGTCKPGPLLMP